MARFARGSPIQPDAVYGLSRSTTTSHTPLGAVEDAGMGLAIWADHLLCAAISALREAAAAVASIGSPVALHDRHASVAEILELRNGDEVLTVDRRYLPPRR